MNHVETTNPEVAPFAWEDFEDYRPLETEADLIAAAQPPRLGAAGAMFKFKAISAHECGMNLACLICNSPVDDVSFHEQRRDDEKTTLAYFGVEWDPTIRL